MSLAEPLWYINKNGFINNLHLKSTFYVLTQQREFFLLQPIHSSFLLLPLKFLSGVLWNGNFYTAVTRHSCMLLRATSKMLCTLFLKYKLKVLGTMEKKSPNTPFLDFSYSFHLSALSGFTGSVICKPWGRCGLCSRQVWAGWQLQGKQHHCPTSTHLPCPWWQLLTVARQADAPKQSYHSPQSNILIHRVGNFPKYHWMKIIP